MKDFLIWTALTFVALTVLLVAGVEGICLLDKDAPRIALYAGGASGLAINVLSVPFFAILASLPKSVVQQSAFWLWWGSAFLARFFGLGVMGFVLNWKFRGQEMAALMAMMALYLPGMLSESVWLAKRYSTMGKDEHG